MGLESCDLAYRFHGSNTVEHVNVLLFGFGLDQMYI